MAATRARDRLYFSVIAEAGEVARNRGSLGEVLPDGFVAAIGQAAAAAADTSIEWTGSSGRAHPIAVVGVAAG